MRYQYPLIRNHKRKVNEKPTIRIEIHTSCPKHKMGMEHIQFRRRNIRTARAESRSSPQMAIRLSLITWTKSHRQTEGGRTLTIRINHDRSAAFERSVKNYWESIKPRLHREFKVEHESPKFEDNLNP